jgi:hypothetical protein
MSQLNLRDLDNDIVLDKAALRGIHGGHAGHHSAPQGVSLADSTGFGLAIGPNAFTKTDTFAVAVPGASAAGSRSTAAVGIPVF